MVEQGVVHIHRAARHERTSEVFMLQFNVSLSVSDRDSRLLNLSFFVAGVIRGVIAITIGETDVSGIASFIVAISSA